MVVKYKTDNESEWGSSFGEKLKTAIAAKGVTQAEVASRIGVSRQVMSRYIHGLTIPSTYKTCQIANVLECDVSSLINI